MHCVVCWLPEDEWAARSPAAGDERFSGGGRALFDGDMTSEVVIFAAQRYRGAPGPNGAQPEAATGPQPSTQENRQGCASL
jgi:hypothetical protein